MVIGAWTSRIQLRYRKILQDRTMQTEPIRGGREGGGGYWDVRILYTLADPGPVGSHPLLTETKILDFYAKIKFAHKSFSFIFGSNKN